MENPNTNYNTPWTVAQIYALNMAERNGMGETRFLKNIDALNKEFLPSGPEFRFCRLDTARSTPDSLVFHVWCNHNVLAAEEVGTNIGWTGHRVIVTPSLAYGVNVDVTGRNIDCINSVLLEIFYDTMTNRPQGDFTKKVIP